LGRKKTSSAIKKNLFELESFGSGRRSPKNIEKEPKNDDPAVLKLPSGVPC